MIQLETTRVQVQNLLAQHNEVEVSVILATVLGNATKPLLPILTDIYKNNLTMPAFKLEIEGYIALPDYSVRAFIIYSKGDEEKGIGMIIPETGESDGDTSMITEEHIVYMKEYFTKCDKVQDIVLVPVTKEELDDSSEEVAY